MIKRQKLRIAIAQINCTVGDLEGNSRRIIEYTQKARGLAVDIVCFPELALTGYPPEDLLLKPKFIADNLAKIKEVARQIPDITAVVGFVDKRGKDIYNAAAVIYRGQLKGVYHKMLLPNYGVFDEKRYFAAGQRPAVFRLSRVIFGVNICEDIWYAQGPARKQALSGARLILNINASPYYAGKIKKRQDVVRKQAKASRVFLVYANLVGGQDELVFDGQSMMIDDQGKLICRAEAFREDLLVCDLGLPVIKAKNKKEAIVVKDEPAAKRKVFLSKKSAKPLEPVAEVYQALTLGIRDYASKNNFKKAVIGLSGGIDSALVAVLAGDALGRENVKGVFMPSRYSSSESQEDACSLAGNLGIELVSISVEQIYKMYLLVLEPHFSGVERDVTEENLQARIRGNILMALSNKFGWLVLTTGNKSEMSTGYATLYGDMAGGLAAIKDVPKILVYKLARYRNSLGQVIPERIMTKEPTAELKPNQKDRDTLPAYEILDPILKSYVEDDESLARIVDAGFDKETVEKVLGMVDKSEYKRRQSPPGIKITPKAFGRDRRMPITNKYRG